MSEVSTKLQGTVRGAAIAIAHETVDQYGNSTVSYDAIINLATRTCGTRSYKATAKGETKEIYADGILITSDTIDGGYDIDWETVSLLDWVLYEKCYGMRKTTGDKEGIVETADGKEMPHFGLLFYEETKDGEGVTTFFPWVQGTQRPDLSGKTAEGGAFDPEFPHVKATASPRPGDNNVMWRFKGKDRLTQIPVIPAPDAQTVSVTLDQHVLELASGGSGTLTATTLPAGQTVTWTTGSSSVATVDDGVVSAEGTGNTIITASITKDGVTYTDTCTVIVAAAPSP